MTDTPASTDEWTMKHVTEEESKRIFAFFRQITKIIGTPRYVLELETEPADTDCYASISKSQQRYRAFLSVCQEWMTLPVDVRRTTIIHEACHLLHHRLDHVVGDTLGLMHEHEHEVFEAAYQREIELIVDQLAVTLEDFAPEWPAE